MYLNEAKFREGQRIVFRSLRERIIYGELVTGIVLHPRGGKSDVQRMITLWGVSQGYLCAGVSININRLLRDQMGDNDRTTKSETTRMEEAIRRYEVRDLRNLETIRVVGYDGWPEEPFSRNEVFASFTIQTLTAKAGEDGLKEWVKSMVATKKPPIFFFDECQMLGGMKPWAKLFYDLKDLGAFVVSMTGTPHREDGEPIPGFNIEVHNTTDIERVVVKRLEDPTLKRISYNQGAKTDFTLRGHIEVGLSYGWNPPEGEPPALCSITRDTFDFEVSAQGDGCPAYSGPISEAPKEVVRKVLGRALREPEVISAAVEKMIYHLDEMRVTHPDVKGIIFTGNDNADDESNAHARQIEREVRRQRFSMKCMIVTNAPDGPKEQEVAAKLASFNNSECDILIVKQAGGVGLDAARIKVGLDMSTVRAYGSGTQRLLRIATPLRDLFQSVWISPQDVQSDYIWDGAVRSNNGEMSITKLEEVDSRIEEKSEEDDPGNEPLIIDFGDVFQGMIYDNTGKCSEISSRDKLAVELLVAARPYLRNKLGFLELLDLSKAVDAGTGFGLDANDLIPLPDPEPAIPVVEHSSAGLASMREKMNATAKRIAENELKQRGYTTESIYDKSRPIFGPHLSSIWYEAKVGIVANPKAELSSIIDIRKLEAIKERLDARERRIGGGGETRISA